MDHIVSSILFLIIILIANTIQVLTGFAGNMLAMPFSIHLIGVNEAKTVLNVFILVACVYIWWKSISYYLNVYSCKKWLLYTKYYNTYWTKYDTTYNLHMVREQVI